MGAALLWACSGTAGKYLFLSGITPVELVQARVTLASLLLFTALFTFRKPLLRIQPADVPPFLVLGGVITTMLQLSYFLAIKYIHVALAILIQYLAPILVGVFSMLFLKERRTLAKIAALILSLGGCYLAVGGISLAPSGMNRWGILWGLCSALFFAGYTLFTERQMHRFSPWTVLFYSLFFACISLNTVLGPLIFLEHGHTARQWLLIVFVAAFGTLIPFGLYALGINHIRATRAIITATLEPIFAAFLGFFLIAETLSPLQIAGGALVIGAIILLQLERERDGLSPAAIRSRTKTDAAKNSLTGTLE
jgi:drug/metabolite transporter (DMT)-like permease